MAKDDYGVFHLAADGVLQSFHPNGTVLDYATLSTNQIQHMIDWQGRDEYLTEVFAGIYILESVLPLLQCWPQSYICMNKTHHAFGTTIRRVLT